MNAVCQSGLTVLYEGVICLGDLRLAQPHQHVTTMPCTRLSLRYIH